MPLLWTVSGIEVVSEEPFVVQLTFEPAGRPGADREYYLREKENICAVCGTDRNCVRKNIVPHEYRRFFSLTIIMSIKLQFIITQGYTTYVGQQDHKTVYT